MIADILRAIILMFMVLTVAAGAVVVVFEHLRMLVPGT